MAAKADIHPSMVMRYFESKDGLFAAAAEFDLRLPDLSKVKLAELGVTLVRQFLDRWEGSDAGANCPRCSASRRRTRRRGSDWPRFSERRSSR